MKRLFALCLSLLSFSLSYSQAITSLNFREWYNPDREIDFSIQVVRESNYLQMYYQFEAKQLALNKYTLTWERRDSFTQREGTALTIRDSTSSQAGMHQQGMMSFDIPAKSWLLVAKVTNQDSKISYTYFKLMEANYPVNGWLEKDNEHVAQKYITQNKEYVVKSPNSATLYVSQYKNDFAAASPPFTDRNANADRFMFYDSTFKISSGSSFIPTKPGLYLFQQDTNAAAGFAFRCVNETYPKFSKISDLIEPLIFVSTEDEYKELLNSNGDKTKFDKVILDITRDRERAKTFMRNYYRRVELANQYFSSYKPGWKTDRGMIYLIFGLPDELSVNDGNEVWYYKTTRTRFTFVKSGSVYDPDNYVLLRDKRFMETWFSMVDLIRKSRF
jgi:GWxTD domain-containing protein